MQLSVRTLDAIVNSLRHAFCSYMELSIRCLNIMWPLDSLVFFALCVKNGNTCQHTFLVQYMIQVNCVKYITWYK